MSRNLLTAIISKRTKSASTTSCVCLEGRLGLRRRERMQGGHATKGRASRSSEVGGQKAEVRHGESVLWRIGGRLIQQLDRIAFANHSFREHGAVDTGRAFVRLRDGFQYGRRFFRCVGIERDHHATRIALENGDSYF